MGSGLSTPADTRPSCFYSRITVKWRISSFSANRGRIANKRGARRDRWVLHALIDDVPKRTTKLHFEYSCPDRCLLRVIPFDFSSVLVSILRRNGTLDPSFHIFFFLFSLFPYPTSSSQTFISLQPLMTSSIFFLFASWMLKHRSQCPAMGSRNRVHSAKFVLFSWFVIQDSRIYVR